MKATKKILTIALFAILATGFVFAGGGKDKAKDDGVVTIKVLNYLDMTSANTTEEVKVVWDGFTKAYPNIKVEREDLFNEPFHQKTEAYAASGSMPDVIYCWPSGRSTTLHTKGLLKDLGPLVERDGLTDKFSSTALDPSAQAGGYIAEIPLGVTTTHVMYVNEAILKECGLKPATTYEELKAQVPVLKAKGYETILMANAEEWVMQSCLFSDIAGRFGGAGWDQAILNGNAKFTDKSFVDALKFVKTLYDDGVLSKNTLATDYGASIGQFASNKGAYMIDGDWRTGAFITDQSTGEALIPVAKQEKDISLMVFPKIPGAKMNESSSAVVGVGFGMSAAIPAGSAKEEAAWTLIKWLQSKEIQEFRTATGGSPTPARIDLDSAKLAEKMEPLQVKLSQFGTKFSNTTVVIDGVFAGSVYDPLNSGDRKSVV